MFLYLVFYIFVFVMVKIKEDKIFFLYIILFLWKYILTVCIDVNCIYYKIYNICIYIIKYCVISIYLIFTI